MAIYLVLLLIVSLIGIKCSHFHENYAGFKQSTAVKGIFAFIILLHHSRDYYSLGTGFADAVFLAIDKWLGQLIVTVFFFYSGFGILESYKSKKSYETTFFRKRILRTLLRFDIAVLIYLIVTLLLGERYPIQNYFLSWIGLTSFNNSNWFIFVILLLYSITLIAFVLNRRLSIIHGEFRIVAIVIMLSLLSWIIIKLTGKRSWWYNTLLCYPAGMLFSMTKKFFDSLMRNNRIYYPFLLCTITIVIIMHRFSSTVLYSLMACIFCLTIVLVTIKIQLNNRILQFLGRYSFSIYVLQRLTMILLKAAGLSQPVLFTGVALISTCIIAVLYEILLSLFEKTDYKPTCKLSMNRKP